MSSDNIITNEVVTYDTNFKLTEHIKYLNKMIDTIKMNETDSLDFISKIADIHESDDCYQHNASLVRLYQNEIYQYYAKMIQKYEKELCYADKLLEIILPFNEQSKTFSLDIRIYDTIVRSVGSNKFWHEYIFKNMTPEMRSRLSDIPLPILYDYAKELLNWPYDRLPSCDLESFIKIKEGRTPEKEKALYRLAYMKLATYVLKKGKLEYIYDIYTGIHKINDNFDRFITSPYRLSYLDTHIKYLPTIDMELYKFANNMKQIYALCSDYNDSTPFSHNFILGEQKCLSMLFNNMSLSVKRYIFGFK